MVGFNRRFDPNFRAARARIDAGEIGDVEMVSITSRDPGPPPLEYMARSGGLFRDMTIHDFDMARFLLGEEPVSVTAVGSVLVDPAIGGVPDIDSAAVTLVTASGKIAQISQLAARQLRVRPADRGARLERAWCVPTTSTNRPSRWPAVGASSAPPLMNFFIERYMPAYYAEVADVRRRRQRGPSAQARRRRRPAGAVLAEAAVRSNAERRTSTSSEI